MSPVVRYELSDPLQILGPSLMLQVFFDLPLSDIINCYRIDPQWKNLIDEYQTSIFRNLAYKISHNKKRIQSYRAYENKEPGTTADTYGCTRYTLKDPAKLVDWKSVCQDLMAKNTRWKHGRATIRWLERNSAWRVKVDPEEQVMYTVSRDDGLQSSFVNSDMDQGLLFEYPDVPPYSHLEFAGGYVIFNTADSYEVHATNSALRRLSPEERDALPPLSDSAVSASMKIHHHPYMDGIGGLDVRREDELREKALGVLTYTKSIRPPTGCWAFRARIDKEYQEGERPVLGLAGLQAIYIYGLTDDTVEVIPTQAGSVGLREIHYIEFDDDYVFICGASAMHVYSRETKMPLLNFAGPDETAESTNFKARYRLENLPYAVGPQSSTTWPEACVREMYIDGTWSQDSSFGVEETYLGRRFSQVGMDFGACHYTTSDLICATEDGVLLILRNYKKVFAIKDEDYRRKVLCDHLLALYFGDSIVQLYTHEDRIVFHSYDMVYLLDASALPPAPYCLPPELYSMKGPSIRILALRDVHSNGLRQASSLQMDERNIYLVYGPDTIHRAATIPDAFGVGRPIPSSEEDERSLRTGNSRPFATRVQLWDFSIKFFD